MSGDQGQPNVPQERFRISLESLKRYAPVYQDALEAKEELDGNYAHTVPGDYRFEDQHEVNLEANGVDPSDMEAMIEVSSLESRYYRGMFALEKLIEQATPLLHSEVAKIAAKAVSHDPEEVHPILFYEAINGLKRGLARYDVSKNMSSVTNYLFQWATTYAKRELNKLEAPFGVPPSRYEKYKKVSAVRSKMTEQLGRYATNQEVLEYFHSGAADLKTFNGPVALRDQGSRANKEIDIKLVEDQEYFEKNLAYTKYLNDDTGEFYPDNVLRVSSEFIAGERSIFKDFMDAEPFTEEAKVVMSNETQQEVPDEVLAYMEQITEARYKQITKEFRALVRENGGRFHKFICEKVRSDDIQGYDADIRQLIKKIEGSPPPKTRRKYRSLYGENAEQIFAQTYLQDNNNSTENIK